MPKGVREPLEVRFWRSVDKTDSCWLWRGSRQKKGYGQLNYKQRPVLTHRFSYELHKGQIPSGMFVCHSCDTPACCNPDHLFLGTPGDNQADMAKKFRGMAKLTPEQVREIRAAPNGARDLARIYGLKSHKTIYDIKRGLIFRHV